MRHPGTDSALVRRGRMATASLASGPSDCGLKVGSSLRARMPGSDTTAPTRRGACTRVPKEGQRTAPGATGAPRPSEVRGEPVAPAATPPARAGHREPGWSFCIVTDGARPAKLRRQIRSIRRLRIPHHEILVAGAPPAWLEGVTKIPMPEAAAQGRLGAMRMALVERARYERLVVCDDDLVFRPDFRHGIERHADDFDALAVRVLNPDGSRYWDRCTVGGPRGHRLLRYDEEEDENVYLSGAICVLRREATLRVRWNADLRFYEGEDVDFSRRLVAAGYRIGFCREASVVHDDPRYRQRGLAVHRHDGPDDWHVRAWGRLMRPITLARGHVEWWWRRLHARGT